jgi:hypothetical protein
MGRTGLLPRAVWKVGHHMRGLHACAEAQSDRRAIKLASALDCVSTWTIVVAANCCILFVSLFFPPTFLFLFSLPPSFPSPLSLFHALPIYIYIYIYIYMLICGGVVLDATRVAGDVIAPSQALPIKIHIKFSETGKSTGIHLTPKHVAMVTSWQALGEVLTGPGDHSQNPFPKTYMLVYRNIRRTCRGTRSINSILHCTVAVSPDSRPQTRRWVSCWHGPSNHGPSPEPRILNLDLPARWLRCQADPTRVQGRCLWNRLPRLRRCHYSCL